MDGIKVKRLKIWNSYQSKLKKLDELGYIRTPKTPLYSANNGHLFYIQCRNMDERTKLINFLKSSDISAIFHYISLHSSDYYLEKHDGRPLINTDEYANTLLRLPLYFELKKRDINRIISKIYEFFNL